LTRWRSGSRGVDASSSTRWSKSTHDVSRFLTAPAGVRERRAAGERDAWFWGSAGTEVRASLGMFGSTSEGRGLCTVRGRR